MIKRRAVLAALISAMSVPAWARPGFLSGGKGRIPESVTTITGATVSPASYTEGDPAGTVVGAITVPASGVPFSGTIALSGADAALFDVSSATLPSNLILADTGVVGAQDINVVPTQAGAVNSGTAYPQVITGASSSGTVLSTFVITETAGATSKGFKRFGLPFPIGDVPTGSAVKIQRGGADVPCQFDERTYWPDGSLKLVICSIRDTDFSASASRTYTVFKYSGSFDNTSSLTLADVTGAYDLNLAITSVTGSTSGSMSDMSASFNTMAGVDTRVTKYAAGPVCDSWLVWGLAVTDSHLVIEWYVTAWKDGAGDIVDLEFAAVPSLYWWSVATKQKLTYTTALKDGATTIETYAAVQHLYRAQWATVRKQNDFQHGMRHWRSAVPTLHYQPDQSYWIASRLVPPLNTALTTWTNPYTNTYTPGSSQSHRANIDATGDYAGRGQITNMDCIAFLTGLASDVRVARVNAMVGLHIPYHYRSNSLRQRPGDASPDTAATIVSMILLDQRGASTPSAYYTFTADGMPAPQNASANASSTATYQAGYVFPGGGTTSGSTVWTLSNDCSHAVPYSYFMYLMEGERYLMQATVDLATKATHTQQDSAFSYRAAPFVNNAYGSPQLASAFGCPTTQWAGIGFGTALSNDRHNGWGALLFGHAYAVLPDNDVQRNCFSTFHDHHFLYIAFSLPYLPGWNPANDPEGTALVGNAFGSGLGSLSGNLGVRPYSPWMSGIQVIGYLANYFCTRNATALLWGNTIANENVGTVEVRMGHADAYRALSIKRSSVSYNASTNPWPARGDKFAMPGVISIASNVITCVSSTYFNSLPYTNGDLVIFCGKNDSFTVIPWPPEVSEGVPYYMVNVSGNTFQVSATEGGAPIALANYSGGQYQIGVQLQSADDITNMRTQMTGVSADDYAPIEMCGLILAHLAGKSEADQTLVDKIFNALPRVAGAGGATWATWSYADPG